MNKVNGVRLQLFETLKDHFKGSGDFPECTSFEEAEELSNKLNKIDGISTEACVGGCGKVFVFLQNDDTTNELEPVFDIKTGEWELEEVFPEYVRGDGQLMAIDAKKEGLLCEGCSEYFGYHANQIGVVSRNDSGNLEHHKFEYMDGILCDTSDESFHFLSREIKDVIESIVLGTQWRTQWNFWRGAELAPKETIDSWCVAIDGWHSSLESSKFSDTMNSIIKLETELNFPIVIVYQRTSNVCSIGLSIYYPKNGKKELVNIFSDGLGFHNHYDMEEAK